MMRRFLFICCLLFALLPASTMGGVYDSDPFDPIDLMGEIDDSERITSEKPLDDKGVVVIKSTESIDITFTVESSVNVKVSDVSGNVIHDDIQNTRQKKNLKLSTSDWDGSVYKIEFENLDNHKVAYGYVVL